MEVTGDTVNVVRLVVRMRYGYAALVAGAYVALPE
jgi:hypothetical protein